MRRVPSSSHPGSDRLQQKSFSQPPNQHGKLLVFKDTLLVTMFLSWGLNIIGVNIAIFHSGLSNAERNELQKDFNDKTSDYAVFINMYDVGGFSRNFHNNYHNAVMTGTGKNQSAESQGIGRILRVSERNSYLKLFSKTLIEPSRLRKNTRFR